MSTQQFSDSSDYLESIRGLHQLHALTVAGKDEGPEADMVRARLEGPWWRLSDVQKKRITGLSEDLYSISEPPTEAEPMNPQAQRKLVEALDARQAKDWDKALDLLRRWGRYLEPALLSYLRGTIWMQAGDYSTATLFFQHAAEREPDNENYAVAYLWALWESDPKTAQDQARMILATDETFSPRIVVQAARIQVSTLGMSGVDVRPDLQELIRVLERTITRLQGHEAMQSSTYAMAVTVIALCHERLGDPRTAVRYYNLAIAADPKNQRLFAFSSG
jgi:tetratricopeptide (TPR) repeat protein